MAKIKVLYAVTKGNWGGAQKYVYDLAANLPENFEAAAVVGEGKILAEKLKAASVKTIVLAGLERNIKLLNDLRFCRRLWQIIRQEHPDILHLNSSKIGGLGALAGRLAGVSKIIFTAHGWAFNEARPAWQKLLIKFLSWLTILFCHQVIVVAEAEQKAVTRWPFCRGKLRLIYHGLGPIGFLPREEARRQIVRRLKAPPASRRPWLITIAELTKNKGLAGAIEAMININALYFIIGAGEERRRLEQLISALGLTEKVFLLGQLPDAARLLPAFDLAVLSSLKEGLPYFLLEAGLAGLPVAAAAVGGVPEVIEDGQTGWLVPSKDSSALAKTIKQALTDSGRSERGQALRRRVLEKFSTAKMEAATWRVYNE